VEKMICQQCGIHPATLHVTKVVQGEKTEARLCEACARESENPFQGIKSAFSIHDLLAGILNFEASANPTKPSQQHAESRCATCGMSYVQFSKQGRFGCSDCYTHFSSRLDPLFRRVHGHTSHIGKVPLRTGGALKTKREVAQLKRQLQMHIEREEFEQAVELRDRIKKLGDA
jgi:protein arginine kinase activator